MPSARVEQFKELVRMDPNEITFFGLGRACLDEGEYEESVKAFQRAIDFKPDYTAVYLLLGEALQKLGRDKEATLIYEEGVRVAGKTRDEIPRRVMERRLRRLRRGRSSPGATEG